MRTGTAVRVALALATAMPAAAAFAAKSPTCGSDVRVNVRIKGTPASPGGNAFVSDGTEVYLDGSQRIAAMLQVNNCTHDFTMNLNQSTRYTVALLSDRQHAGKHFNFDRVGSVPVTPDAGNTEFGQTAFCTDGVVRDASGAFVKNADGYYQDNYGGCGMDENGWYVRRAGVIGLYEGPSSDFRLRYQPSPVDFLESPCAADPSDPVCSASYIRVYHPSASTWILRPEGAAEAALLKFEDREYRYQSTEIVPAEIVVTRK